jgi:hypothetical protein
MEISLKMKIEIENFRKFFPQKKRLIFSQNQSLFFLTKNQKIIELQQLFQLKRHFQIR